MIVYFKMFYKHRKYMYYIRCCFGGVCTCWRSGVGSAAAAVICPSGGGTFDSSSIAREILELSPVTVAASNEDNTSIN